MADDVDRAGRARTTGRTHELSVRLAVPEMDCPSCARKVDKSLQRVDGVLEATLLPTTVTYNPDRVSTSDVIAAIEGAGYEVVADERNSGDEIDGGFEIAPPSEVWTSSRAIKTWIGAVFVALGVLFEFLLVGQNPIVAGVLNYPLTLADGLF